MNLFAKTANQKEHLGYKNQAEIFQHTVDSVYANKLTLGIDRFLKLTKWNLPKTNQCLDIGCGGGHS